MTLKEFFEEHPKVALAFSGGVDSTFLLYEAVRWGADIRAYFVKSQFQPDFELEDAKKAVEDIGASFKILEVDVLSDQHIRSNPDNRCYYCKKNIFNHILKAAEKDGYREIIDGTNASDKSEDRPGMIALEEMNVFSPLRICGLSKREIRILSKDAGLFTWDKPSYACLATRICTGTKIDDNILNRVEKSEDALRERGFSDFRVRLFHEAARLQLSSNEFERFFTMRHEIVDTIKPYFSDILLDLKER